MAFAVATAYVNNDAGSSVTSGSFNVVTGDLIVVVGHADEDGNGATLTWTISDNQAPDLTYTEILRRNDADGLPGGVIAWYSIIGSNITGLTVTLAVSGTALPDSPAIKVYKASAADFDAADVIGASTENNWTTAGAQTANITPETSGTGVLVCTDWNVTTTSSADTTFTGFVTSGDISGGSGYVALTAASAKNADMGASATPAGNYLWFEIRAGSGGGGSPIAVRSAYYHMMGMR